MGETKRSYKDIQQRDDVRHDVSTVHLLHMPTEGPERQEVIKKGQSANRRTRTSRSYQQSPECQTGTDNKNDRHNGNHTRIGCSYTTVVPMNINSHREVGDLADERKRANETPYQNDMRMQEADYQTTTTG